MNWRDNYLVSETVSQLSSHNNVKSLFAGEAALTTSHADEPRWRLNNFQSFSSNEMFWKYDDWQVETLKLQI